VWVEVVHGLGVSYFLLGKVVVRAVGAERGPATLLDWDDWNWDCVTGLWRYHASID
jgi:hypothetical protein